MGRSYFRQREGFMGNVALAATLAGVLLVSASCGNPLAGTRGLGDPYLPDAGNGGYDVEHYQLDLTVDPVSGMLDGSAAITARATQQLAAFDLDFAWDGKIAAVTVDGASARWKQGGNELTVTCPTTLASGQDFIALVTYSGKPKPVKDVGPPALGWEHPAKLTYTLDEPVGAATWFPGNDYPTDKATYAFNITVPKPYVAAANGVLVKTEDRGTDRTFTWEMRQPLAAYLASVTVDDYVAETTVAPNGVPIRSYFDRTLAADGEKAFARTGEVLAYFADLFGPYPFDAYGVVVPAANTGAAMENQTLSLYGRDILEKRMLGDEATRGIYLAHELAHQWFGDSVTIEQWKDIWLNEGFASYASWLWLEHDQGKQALAYMVDQSMQTLKGGRYPLLSDPGLDGLFSANVYRRGALTLHALRLTVGDSAFFALLKEWASRYEHGNATTADFIALTKQMAPDVPSASLTALFGAWLDSKPLPTLPAPLPGTTP